MLFHNCPACDTGGISRRSLLAGLGAAAAAATLPAPAVQAQARTLIDTHHHFYPPNYLQMQKEYEGKRNIPRIPRRIRLDAHPRHREHGQERRPHRGDLARLHPRPVVRRRSG